MLSLAPPFRPSPRRSLHLPLQKAQFKSLSDWSYSRSFHSYWTTFPHGSAAADKLGSLGERSCPRPTALPSSFHSTETLADRKQNTRGELELPRQRVAHLQSALSEVLLPASIGELETTARIKAGTWQPSKKGDLETKLNHPHRNCKISYSWCISSLTNRILCITDEPTKRM